MDKIFAVGFAIAMAIQLLGKQYVGLTMGVLSLMSMGMITREVIYGRLDIIKPQFSYGFYAMVGVVVSWGVSSYFALNPAESWSEMAEMLGIAVAGYCVYKALVYYDVDWRLLLNTLSALIVLMAVLVLMNIFFNIIGDVRWGSSSYSSVLAVLYPLIFYYAFTHCQNSWARFSVLCLAVAALFALGGRTGYVVFVVLAMACLFLLPRATYIERLKIAGLALTANIVGGCVGLYAYKIRIGESAFMNRVADIDTNRPASGRIGIWQDSLNRVYEHPWFGVGVDCYRDLGVLHDVDKHVLHPHNIVLELLVNTGVFGFLTFIGVIAVLSFQFLKSFFRYNGVLKPLYASIFLMLVGYGIASMALTSIFRGWWYVYLVIILILIGYATNRMRDNRTFSK